LSLNTGTYSSLSLRVGDQIHGVAQTQHPASQTIFVGIRDNSTASASLYWYEPLTDASGVWVAELNGSGNFTAVGAGRTHVYGALSGPNQKVMAYSQTDPSASYVVQTATGDWHASGAAALAVYDNGSGSPTLFLGTSDGDVWMLQEGSTATTARQLGQWALPEGVRGLAFATPTLYVSVFSEHKVYALDVTQNPVSSYVLAAQSGTARATSAQLWRPSALALDLDPLSGTPRRVFIGVNSNNNPEKKILELNLGAL
jgi:hypothetical protein